MRKIEKQILNVFFADVVGDGAHCFSLSTRDKIHVNCVKAYYLWNTCIFSTDWVNNHKIFHMYTSSSGSGENAISTTTKSRLNAFLSYLGLSPLYQKNYTLYWNGKELKTDTKYEIDTVNKTIEEVK